MRSIDQVIIKVLLFHFWLQLEKNLFFRTLTLSHNLSQSSLYLQTIHLSFKFGEKYILFSTKEKRN